MHNQDERNHKRRVILIDREFQLGFIARFGGFLLFYLLLFIVIAVVGPVGFALLGDDSEWAQMEVAFRVDVLLRLILAPIVCTFLCLFIHGVIETFRVAGPNYRFKQIFKDLARLRIPEGVRVRKSDYLQDTALGLNEALITLHRHVAVSRQKSQEALRRLQRGDTTAGMASVQELGDLLRRFELVTQAPECKPIDPVAPSEAESQEELAVAEPTNV